MCKHITSIFILCFIPISTLLVSYITLLLFYLALYILSKHPYSYAYTSLFIYIIIYLRCISCLPSVSIHSMYWYYMLYILIYIVITLI